MSKKIIFLADSISTQTAGIHVYGKQLIKSIIQQFPDNTYLSISSSEIDIKKVEQIIIPIKSYLPAHLRIRQLTTIPKVIRRLNPDIVIELAHFGPFNLPSSIKRITVIHDLSAVTHPEYHSFLSHRIQKSTLPGIINRAHSIITNSFFTKGEIVRLYNTEDSKIQVLYPSLESMSQVEARQGLRNNKLYFLCVGTIEPRKNYVSVIKAFEQIHQRSPEFNLIIVGRSGWKNKAFYRYLAASTAKSNIELTGFVSDHQLSDLYAQAFAFISASHFEGFGIPILEASKNKLPLLIAKNSSQQEIAQDAALFFDSQSSGDLADQMSLLIEHKDLRNELMKKSETVFTRLNDAHNDQLSKLRLP